MRIGDGFGDRLREARRELVHEGEEERLLVGEVVVDGALGRARGVDDVVHQRPVIPFLRKNLKRRLENPIARRHLAHEENPCR